MAKRRLRAKGSRPQYIVRHTEFHQPVPGHVTSLETNWLMPKRAPNFGAARDMANKRMSNSLCLSVLIEGPGGYAEFNRADDNSWMMSYSTLEELPMPGQPEDL